MIYYIAEYRIKSGNIQNTEIGIIGCSEKQAKEIEYFSSITVPYLKKLNIEKAIIDVTDLSFDILKDVVWTKKEFTGTIKDIVTFQKSE